MAKGHACVRGSNQLPGDESVGSLCMRLCMFVFLFVFVNGGGDEQCATSLGCRITASSWSRLAERRWQAHSSCLFGAY